MEAHLLGHDNLEEFSDPANYDIEDSGDTGVVFSSDIARKTGSRILEIGCGTGRVSTPIARMGFINEASFFGKAPADSGWAASMKEVMGSDWYLGMSTRVYRVVEAVG
jgi:hypothetical protein